MLDARPVNLQAFLQAFLDGAVVLVLLHVDEVDHDQAGEIAQAHLAAGLFGRFQVGAHGGLLDIALAGRLAGVHVDGDEGFGLVDHEIAAGLQLDGRRVDRIELAFDGLGDVKRIILAPLLNLAGLARHDDFREVFRLAVGFVALDPDFLDLLVEHVAHRAVNEAAFGIDQRGSFGGQRLLDDLFPEFGEVIIVALDLGLGALGAGGADDQALAFRDVELRDDGLEALAVRRVDDFAGDAAAARCVRHQDRVATGERKIGGQGGALVAAFFLDDLNQHDLPAADHFLDLVALGDRRAGLGRAGRAFAAGAGARLARLRRIVAALLAVLVRIAFRGGFGLIAVVMLFVMIMVMAGVIFGIAILGVHAVGNVRAVIVVIGFDGGGGFFRSFLQEGLTVLGRQLVIVRVDLAEGEEAMAVAAILDKGGLERGLHPGHFGEIDVSAELFVAGGFEVEIVNLAVVDDRHPCFFGMGGVDKHQSAHVTEPFGPARRARAQCASVGPEGRL